MIKINNINLYTYKQYKNNTQKTKKMGSGNEKQDRRKEKLNRKS